MLFDTVFKRCISSEGGLTLNPKDSGNWTDGKVWVGVLAVVGDKPPRTLPDIA
jgi:lysozyme family protein